MQSTPASLLEQLCDSDRSDAWPRFVRLYAPLLARWATRLGARGPDRDDLVQDVYAALVVAIPTYRHEGSFKVWLHTIILNKWRDRCRKASRVPATGPLPDQVPDPADDPAAVIDDAEYHRILVSRATTIVKSDFSHETWQAFWASTVEGESASEIAVRFNISTNAVYLARARVLSRLRAVLAGLLE